MVPIIRTDESYHNAADDQRVTGYFLVMSWKYRGNPSTNKRFNPVSAQRNLVSYRSAPVLLTVAQLCVRVEIKAVIENKQSLLLIGTIRLYTWSLAGSLVE